MRQTARVRSVRMRRCGEEKAGVRPTGQRARGNRSPGRSGAADRRSHAMLRTGMRPPGAESIGLRPMACVEENGGRADGVQGDGEEAIGSRVGGMRSAGRAIDRNAASLSAMQGRAAPPRAAYRSARPAREPLIGSRRLPWIHRPSARRQTNHRSAVQSLAPGATPCTSLPADPRTMPLCLADAML